MKSYRFARRAFLGSIGAATGLRVLLRNLEATAQGAPPPPRFLLAYWPNGTIRYNFLPQGSGTSFTLSRILQPFAPLVDDMIVLYGLSTAAIGGPGGSHEGGVVKTTTGATTPGTRSVGESDDSMAGGPSFDQIFAHNVPALQRPGAGYANALCDARVDIGEISSRCLSYAYATQTATSAIPGGIVSEHLPLLPELGPLNLYAQLFSGFMPGGDTDPNRQRMRNALRARKSVLDYALRELGRVRTLVPASERPRIDIHTDAIRKVETQLSASLGDGGSPPPAGCAAPAPPDGAITGKSGSHNDYGNPLSPTSDNQMHEQVGKLHAAIIRAAFQCDIIRVATFQWAPATNHVAFSGLYPGDPGGNYMLHPTSHRITDSADTSSTLPPEGQRRDTVEFLTNVFTWYNQKTADILLDFKNATDAYGGNLLDQTIVPYVTEVAEATGMQQPKPALIFGGRRLGMQGHRFLNFAQPRSHNDLWATIAQAYLRTTDPLARLQDETFVKTNVAPIAGLWSDPG